MRWIILLLLLGACTTTSVDEMPMDHSKPMDEHMMAPITSEDMFVIDMIPHHQEAVDTALLVKDSEDEELATLAQAIITTQTEEINMMRGWVDEWYGESDYTSQYQNMMPDLLSLEGDARDEAFIEGMIMHHQGAVQMAEQVLELNPRPEVKEFAETVIAVQTKEITQMRALLEKY